MDVDSLSSFLQDEGFPLEYCETFEGLFGTLPLQSTSMHIINDIQPIQIIM